MTDTQFLNLTDFWRQSVGESVQLFELNAPGYNALKKYSDRKTLTEKGFRIPVWWLQPGGHTFFVPSASDFNAASSPQSQSMYVFPTGYALPMDFQGPLLRALRIGGPDALLSAREMFATYSETAHKRIEMMVYGNGDETLAVSATTGGSGTVNFTTAPNTTPGETKGAIRLKQTQIYQSINPATGAVRGTFSVDVEGTTSVTATFSAGTTAAGDPIVDVGGYQKAPRGFAHLIDDTNRDLQSLNTTTFRDLKSPVIDKVNALETPADIETTKATLNTRNNVASAEENLICFTTYCRMSNLRKQGYGLKRYMGNDNTTSGIAKKYTDGDTVWVECADMDEDRYYFVKPDSVLMFEEMPFGDYDLDGQDLRMNPGANVTGSDRYFKAIGTRSNVGIRKPKACAAIKRCSITGIVTQVTANAS